MFSLERKKTKERPDSIFQMPERLSFRGEAGSVLDQPRVKDTQQWAQVIGSQILVGYQEKLPVRTVR